MNQSKISSRLKRLLSRPRISWFSVAFIIEWMLILHTSNVSPLEFLPLTMYIQHTAHYWTVRIFFLRMIFQFFFNFYFVYRSGFFLCDNRNCYFRLEQLRNFSNLENLFKFYLRIQLHLSKNKHYVLRFYMN